MAPLTSPKIASITPKRTLADAVEEWTSRYSCTWTPKIESFSG
jgi:hypothetical protein